MTERVQRVHPVIELLLINFHGFLDGHNKGEQRPQYRLHDMVLEENQTAEAVVKNISQALGLPEYGIVLKVYVRSE